MVNKLGVLLVAAFTLAGAAGAEVAWRAVDEPEGAWVKVMFVEGGEPRAAWCRSSVCADIENAIKNSPIPLFLFEPAGEEKSESGIVTIHQSSESPYTLASGVGFIRVAREGRRVDNKPRFQRTTDPNGRNKMRVLPPKVCPPDCKKD